MISELAFLLESFLNLGHVDSRQDCRGNARYICLKALETFERVGGGYLDRMTY